MSRPPHRRPQWRQAWISAILLWAIAAPGVAAEGRERNSRLAIYADAGLEEQASTLTDTLSKVEGIELVERGELGRILEERGLPGRADSLAEQALLVGADAVVWVSGAKRGNDLGFRIISTRTGLVLAWEVSDASQFETAVTETLARVLPKLGQVPKDAWLLTISSRETKGVFSTMEREIESALASRLAGEPSVFVLERRKLDEVLSGEAFSEVPKAELWGGSAQVEVIVGRAPSDPKLLAASVQLTLPGERKASVGSTGSEVSELIDPLVKGILDALGLASAVGPANREADLVFYRAKLGRLLYGGSAMNRDQRVIGETAVVLAALGDRNLRTLQYRAAAGIANTGAGSWDHSGIREFALRSPLEARVMATALSDYLESDLPRWRESLAGSDGSRAADEWLLREILAGASWVLRAADTWEMDGEDEVERLRKACAAHVKESGKKLPENNHGLGMAKLILDGRWWAASTGDFLDDLELRLNEVFAGKPSAVFGSVWAEASVAPFQPGDGRRFPRRLDEKAGEEWTSRFLKWTRSDNPILQAAGVVWLSARSPFSISAQERDDILAQALVRTVHLLASGKVKHAWSDAVLSQMSRPGEQRHHASLHEAGLEVLRTWSNSATPFVFVDPSNAAEAALLREAVAKASHAMGKPVLVERIARLDTQFPPEAREPPSTRLEMARVPVALSSGESLSNIEVIGGDEFVVEIDNDARRPSRFVLWNPRAGSFVALGSPAAPSDRAFRITSSPVISDTSVFWVGGRSADGFHEVVQLVLPEKKWFRHPVDLGRAESAGLVAAVLGDALFLEAAFSAPEVTSGLVRVSRGESRYFPGASSSASRVEEVLAIPWSGRVAMVRRPEAKGRQLIEELDPGSGAWAESVSAQEIMRARLAAAGERIIGSNGNEKRVPSKRLDGVVSVFNGEWLFTGTRPGTREILSLPVSFPGGSAQRKIAENSATPKTRPSLVGLACLHAGELLFAKWPEDSKPAAAGVALGYDPALVSSDIARIWRLSSSKLPPRLRAFCGDSRTGLAMFEQTPVVLVLDSQWEASWLPLDVFRSGFAQLSGDGKSVWLIGSDGKPARVALPGGESRVVPNVTALAGSVVAPSPDESLLAIAEPKKLRIVRVSSGESVFEAPLERRPEDMMWSGSGASLGVKLDAKTFRVWKSGGEFAAPLKGQMLGFPPGRESLLFLSATSGLSSLDPDGTIQETVVEGIGGDLRSAEALFGDKGDQCWISHRTPQGGTSVLFVDIAQRTRKSESWPERIVWLKPGWDEGR